MAQQGKSLMTPEIEALIGYMSEVTQMHGVVDKESIRLFATGIPDQDPHYWDEELAKPRFGGVTAPPSLVRYIALRKPPWEEDKMDEIMNDNPFDDGGGGISRRDEETALPPVRWKGSRYLHAGNEVEIFRYPRLGDRIFQQSKYLDIQEKMGSSGPFLLVTSEKRFWDQNDELIYIERHLGIMRGPG